MSRNKGMQKGFQQTFFIVQVGSGCYSSGNYRSIDIIIGFDGEGPTWAYQRFIHDFEEKGCSPSVDNAR